MVPFLFYAACAVASAGLLLLLRPNGRHGHRPRSVATVLGLAGVAWIFVLIVQSAFAGQGSIVPPVLMALFGFIAVGSAVRVITHPRPVFSALYFVLVVISSAAIYIMLSSEFVGFSLVIVYAGAILITYLFVLMLAQQSPSGADGAQSAEYDRVAREPAGAVFVGFVIVAVLGSSIFGSGVVGAKATAAQIASVRQAWHDLELMPSMVLSQARAVDPSVTAIEPRPEGLVEVLPDLTARVLVKRSMDGPAEPLILPLPMLPGNPARVGISLVTRFPVSLEVAGVILLMAMLGAVVLAKRQGELAENEKRSLAGMKPTVDRNLAEGTA